MTIAKIGVVGAGAMGAGIAQSCLAAGMQVILFDSNYPSLVKAETDIFARLGRQIEKGQLPESFIAVARQRLTIASTLEELGPAEIVIEAIIEHLEPKRVLFGKLEAVVSSDAILATNTSSLSVASIGANCLHKR